MMHNDMSEYIFSPAFKAIANISSNEIFVYLKNINSKYVFLSNNICNLSNITLQEALGKSDIDFNWGKKQASAFRNDDLFVTNNKRNHISEYLICNGKNFLWIKTEKIPILDKRQNVIGILGIAQDVSYKKMLTRSHIANKKNKIDINQSPAAIVIELFEEYIRNNYKNHIDTRDEYSFIRNSFIKKLSCELSSKDEKYLYNIINLENQLNETLLTFIENRELIVIGTGKVKTKYYIYLIICLCFIELYNNKSLREKIMINIDDNIIRLIINRAGERHKFGIGDDKANNKFITNYLTSDIMNLLNIDLEIFTIDGLVSAINVIIDTQQIIYN